MTSSSQGPATNPATKWIFIGFGIITLLFGMFVMFLTFIIKPGPDTIPLIIPRAVAVLLCAIGIWFFKYSSRAGIPAPKKAEPEEALPLFRAGSYKSSTAGLFRQYTGEFLLVAAGGLIGVLFLAVWFLNDTTLGMLVIALSMIASAFGAMIFIVNKSGQAVQEVELSGDGLGWKAGNSRGQMAWRDISEVFRNEIELNGILKRDCRIRSADGREVTLTHLLDDYERLMVSIETATGKVMLPARWAELRRGPVKFGPVTVHPAGLSLVPDLLEKQPSERFVRWNEVRGFELQKGALIVYPSSKPHPNCDFLPVSLSLIPNYRVLLEILVNKHMTMALEGSGQ